MRFNLLITALFSVALLSCSKLRLFYKLLIGVVFLTSMATQTAAQNFPLSDYAGCGYVTSSQLRESNKNLIEAEKGMFTTVPLDYANPARGTTEIYSYFVGDFDANQPTYVLFTGGPGQNSHLQMAPKFAFYGNLGFNFLMLDQRGIALSRLANEEMAKDGRNFSSEATARDVLTIINKLGIEKISVYGASYGTVPATIFASFFPERTVALVLEGVVYDGWNGVMSGHNVTGQTQKFYDSFSDATKDRLDQLMASKKLNEAWFPMMTRAFLMQYGTYRLPMFKEAIHEALVVQNLESNQDVGRVFNERAAKFDTNTSTLEAQEGAIKWYKLMEHTDKCRTIGDSDDLNHLIMLQEFDAGLLNVTSSYALKNRKVVPVPGANYSPYLPKFTNMKLSSYSASQYPVQVPTFYIQGTADSATPAPGASLHYKHAAKGPAQLLFFKGSSHMPFGTAIFGMDKAETQWADLQKIFAQLLSGTPMSCESKSHLEKKYSYINIAVATKGFSEKIKCN